MKNTPSRKLGIKDIAKQAGVSIGTVDRVLHNRGEVKEETRSRINLIIEQMGYTPNLLAKSLASKKTYKIAVVIPDSSDDNPYWQKPAEGIGIAARELENFHAEIRYEHFNASDEESFNNVLEKVCNQPIDGLVLTPVFRQTALTYLQLLDNQGIPYVFIDIDMPGSNNLGYFGQDARQSGIVAGKFMNLFIPDKANIFIVKQTNRKIFSGHIESRVEGFLQYLFQKRPAQDLNVHQIEIDLLNPEEPDATLGSAIIKHPEVNGIFVPNSRAFRMAQFLNKHQLNNCITIGYDLLDQNIELLQRDMITCLISQKPEEQSYKAIMSLFHFLAHHKPITKTNYSPIDIIIKENIDYYRI